MFIIYHWMHRFTNILIKWCQARLRKTSRSFSISLSFQLCLPAPPYLMHVPLCLPIPLPPSLPLQSPAILSLPVRLASWRQEWREACSYTGYEWLYNNQINARALIGQSAVVYCAGKLTEKSHVFWIYYIKAINHKFSMGYRLINHLGCW